MPDAPDLLDKLRILIEAKKYRVRLHAVRHMVEEGFRENDILTAVLERCKILEDYPDDSRCLLLGHFSMTDNVSSPLHVVCDYSNNEVVDIVTAYIPQKPWWETPSRRGR